MARPFADIRGFEEDLPADRPFADIRGFEEAEPELEVEALPPPEPEIPAVEIPAPTALEQAISIEPVPSALRSVQPEPGQPGALDPMAEQAPGLTAPELLDLPRTPTARLRTPGIEPELGLRQPDMDLAFTTLPQAAVAPFDTNQADQGFRDQLTYNAEVIRGRLADPGPEFKDFKAWLNSQMQPGKAFDFRGPPDASPEQLEGARASYRLPEGPLELRAWRPEHLASMLKMAGVPEDPEGGYRSYLQPTATLETQIKALPAQLEVGRQIGVAYAPVALESLLSIGRSGNVEALEGIKTRLETQLEGEMDANRMRALQQSLADVEGELAMQRDQAAELPRLMDEANVAIREVRSNLPLLIPGYGTQHEPFSQKVWNVTGESLFPTLAGLAGWVVTGGVGGAATAGLLPGMLQQAGSSMNEALDAYGAPYDVAAKYAFINGLLEAPFEFAALKVLSEPGDKMLQRLLAAMFLGDPTMEMATTAYQNIVSYAYFHPDTSLKDVLEELALSYSSGAATTMFMVPLVHFAPREGLLPAAAGAITEQIRGLRYRKLTQAMELAAGEMPPVTEMESALRFAAPQVQISRPATGAAAVETVPTGAPGVTEPAAVQRPPDELPVSAPLAEVEEPEVPPMTGLEMQLGGRAEPILSALPELDELGGRPEPRVTIPPDVTDGARAAPAQAIEQVVRSARQAVQEAAPAAKVAEALSGMPTAVEAALAPLVGPEQAASVRVELETVVAEAGTRLETEENQEGVLDEVYQRATEVTERLLEDTVPINQAFEAAIAGGPPGAPGPQPAEPRLGTPVESIEIRGGRPGQEPTLTADEGEISMAASLYPRASKLLAERREPQFKRTAIGKEGEVRVQPVEIPEGVTKVQFQKIQDLGLHMRGGRIVGSPPHVLSYSDVQRDIVRNVRLLERAPPESLNWYRQAGAMIRRYGRTPEQRERLVRMVAISSREAPVARNVSDAIRAAIQMAEGRPVEVGIRPTQVGPAIEAALARPEQVDTSLHGVGPKVMNFYRNLRDEVFESDEHPQAVTVDRWMARLFGQRTNLGPEQYNYTASLLRAITARYNAKHGTSLKPRQVQAGLWQMAIEGAGEDATPMADVFEDLAAAVSAEAVPSHLAGKTTHEVRQEITRRLTGAIITPERNMLAEALSIGPHVEELGDGAFGASLSPTIVSEILTPRELGGAVDASPAELYALSWMYVFRQDAVPYFRLDATLFELVDGSVSLAPDASLAAVFTFSAEPTPEALQAIHRDLFDRFGERAGFTRMGARLVVINYVNFPMADDGAFMHAVEEFSVSWGSHGIEKTHLTGAQSAWLDVEAVSGKSWLEDPSGDDLLAAIAERRPALEERLPPLRGRVESELHELVQEVGAQARPDAGQAPAEISIQWVAGEFYSALQRQLVTTAPKKASATQWANYLAGLPQKGVKQSEIEWVFGLDDVTNRTTSASDLLWLHRGGVGGGSVEDIITLDQMLTFLGNRSIKTEIVTLEEKPDQEELTRAKIHELEVERQRLISEFSLQAVERLHKLTPRRSRAALAGNIRMRIEELLGRYDYWDSVKFRLVLDPRIFRGMEREERSIQVHQIMDVHDWNRVSAMDTGYKNRIAELQRAGAPTHMRPRYPEYTNPGGTRYREIFVAARGRLNKEWSDGHGSYSHIENPIVRLRVKDRSTGTGDRVLFIEEIQPPTELQFKRMPAVLQKNWMMVGLKYALQLAVDGDYTHLSWVNAEDMTRTAGGQREGLGRFYDEIIPLALQKLAGPKVKIFVTFDAELGSDFREAVRIDDKVKQRYSGAVVQFADASLKGYDPLIDKGAPITAVSRQPVPAWVKEQHARPLPNLPEAWANAMEEPADPSYVWAVMNDLIGAGMHEDVARALNHVRIYQPFGTGFTQTAHAGYEINHAMLLLRSETYHQYTAGTDPTTTIALRGFVAHELGHALDNIGMPPWWPGRAGGWSVYSPRLEMLVKDDEVGNVNVTPLGDLAGEALEVFLDPATDDAVILARGLAYPMLHLGREDVDPAFIKTELFAQVHRFYLTNRAVISQLMPRWYALFEDIYNADGTSAKGRVSGTAAIGARVREALQSPSAPTRAREQEFLRPYRADQRRAGAGQGSPGVAGVSADTGDRGVAAVRLDRPDQIRQFVRERFRIAVVSGRVPIRRALGTYNPPTHVIRLKDPNALGVLAHEVGHHLSNTVGALPALKQLHQAELRRLTPPAYANRTNAVKTEEGLAEYVRIWLTNPADAARLAPHFHRGFESLVLQDPRVRVTLEDIRRGIAANAALSPEEAIAAKVGQGQPPKPENLAEAYERGRDATERAVDEMIRLTLDRFHPIKRMVEDAAGDDAMRDLLGRQNPYKIFRLLAGVPRTIEDWLLKARVPFDYNKRLSIDNYGMPLAESIKPAFRDKETEKKFAAYLIAKRADELHGEGREHLLSRAEIDAGLGLETPEFIELAQRVYEYNDALLDYRLEAGILTQDQVDAMREYEAYVPFFRISQIEPGEDKGGGGHFVTMHRLRGGTQNLRDVYESMVRNTVLTIIAANRNAAIRSIAHFVSAHQGMGRWAERTKLDRTSFTVFTDRVLEDLRRQGLKVPKKIAQSLAQTMTFFTPSHAENERERVLVYMDNGEYKALQVNDEALWKALHSFSLERMNLLLTLLAIPPRILRFGVVMAPDFMVANFMRDTFSAFVNSVSRFLPVYSTAKGMIEQTKLTEQWRDNIMLANSFGAAYPDIWRGDPEEVKTIVRRMARRAGISPLKILTPTKLADYLGIVGQMFERGSRQAEFDEVQRTMIERGVDPVDAALEGAFAAREVSVDFSMRGANSMVQAIVALAPFLNPAMQGLYKFSRTMGGEGPSRGKLVIAGTTMALWSLLLYFLNRDEDWYKRLEDWEKNTYWHLPGGFWRIPKPFEPGLFFASMPEMIAELTMRRLDGSARAARDFRNRMVQGLGMVLGLRIMPHVPNVWLQASHNYDAFTGRPIIPERVEDWEPMLQFRPRSSLTSLELGRATHELGEALYAQGFPDAADAVKTSPAMTDFLVRQLFGTLGVYSVMASDQMLQLLGDYPEPPEPDWWQMPGIRRFVHDPNNPNARQMTEFYEDLKRIRRMVKSLQSKLMDEATAEAYKSLREPLQERAKKAEGVARQLRDLNRRERDITLDKEMSGAEKAAENRELQQRRREIVEQYFEEELQ